MQLALFQRPCLSSTAGRLLSGNIVPPILDQELDGIKLKLCASLQDRYQLQAVGPYDSSSSFATIEGSCRMNHRPSGQPSLQGAQEDFQDAFASGSAALRVCACCSRFTTHNSSSRHKSSTKQNEENTCV